jgi:hypothetical protein
MTIFFKAFFISFVLISQVATAQITWPESLTITPEKSDFVRTSTYADVIHFLDHLKSKSANIRIISMGKSLEGKEIPVAVLANPAVANEEEARASGKPVIYVQGNIHAGEVEGKEALLMLMREILLGDKKNLIENQILLFAPIYNTDSNDKMEKGRRPSQEDSPIEVGLRENSKGLDLNRDGMKMEALETQGLIMNIISRWDPQLFVDLHTTNGTWHAYPLTWAPSYHSAGEHGTYEYTRQMLKSITTTIKDKHGLNFGPYGEYHLEEGWPLKNFYTYNHHPRYLVNQFGLRNRMAILSEAFSHERFYQRINSTYQFVLEILNYTNVHAREIEAVNKKAEDDAIQLVIKNAGKAKKGVRFKMAEGEKLNQFITYDYISTTKPDGTSQLIRTGKIVAYDNINYHASFRPTVDVTLPRGYIIPAEFANIAELLKRHGIKTDVLAKAKSFSGESFTIEKLDKGEKKFEGHAMATAYGHFLKSNKKFKKGDYVVDLAQPLANLIFYLLEPQSDDGLVTWNFFDSYLEKQGVNNKPVQYPVFKYIN